MLCKVCIHSTISMDQTWTIRADKTSDPIQVRYDEARRGYVITQDRIHVNTGVTHVVDADVEVAFVPETLEATKQEIDARCCANQPVVY